MVLTNLHKNVLLLKEVDSAESRETEDELLHFCDFWSSPIPISIGISPFEGGRENQQPGFQ